VQHSPILPLGGEFVELLYGRSAVWRRLDQFAFAAGSAQSILTSRGCRPGHDPTLLELLATAGEQRRLLVDPRLARDPQIIDKATRRQVDIRVHSGSLRQMLVFDDRYAVVPLDQTDLSTGALLLRAPLAALCDQLFEFLWAEAHPLGAAPAEPGRSDGMTARELEVVHLLVHGATDHQVANRLNVSSRTVRNVVADLHRRFGTTSRMALGFRLAYQRRSREQRPTG